MQTCHTLQLQAERLNKASRSIRTCAGNISITERLFNQASQVLYPGGTVNQLSYDGFGRLAQLKYKSPNQQTLLQRQYQYDPMSNITRVDENKVNTTNAYLYQYDQLYRLTNADNPSGLPDEQYAYDKLGNRLLDNGKPNPATANQQWQYNANNQLTQSATIDTATFGSNARAIDHRYDANGNLTQLTTELTTPNQTGSALANPYDNQQYSYDAQNRLTAVQDSLGNLIASYQYDTYGQRIRKTIHRTLNVDGTWQLLTTPNTFSYFYRDEGLSTQYKTAGQDITTPKQIAQYGWLPNGVWGTNPIWINTSKRTTTTANSQTTTTISPPDYYYYQNDHLGTPQQLIDSAGNLVWQQKSTAFGEAQVTLGDATSETSHTSNTPSTGVIANPFRFAGQYYDIETNTNYNYHRQYNFREGGYTQTDPIGLAGGLNRQAYVNSNPIKLIDPSGLTIYGGPAGSGVYQDLPPPTGCRKAKQFKSGDIYGWEPCEPPTVTPPVPTCLCPPCGPPQGGGNPPPANPPPANPLPANPPPANPPVNPGPDPGAGDPPDCEKVRLDFYNYCIAEPKRFWGAGCNLVGDLFTPGGVGGRIIKRVGNEGVEDFFERLDDPNSGLCDVGQMNFGRFCAVETEKRYQACKVGK